MKKALSKRIDPSIVSITIVVLVGILTVIFFTFPLIFVLSEYRLAFKDFLFYDWLFQYTSQAITDGSIFDLNQYFHSNQFYPSPYSLAFNDIILIPSLFIYFPIFFVTNNPVTSLNLLILVSLFLNFLSSFYVCNVLIKNKIASIYAAIIYTFSPIVFIRFGGHINHLQRYFIPFVLLFSLYFLQNPNKRNAFAFFSFLSLSFLTNIQLTIFSAVFISVFLFITFSFFLRRRSALSWILQILKNSLILIPFVLIVLSLYYPYIEMVRKENMVRSIDEVSIFSARPFDYLMKVKNNFLWEKIYKYLDLGNLREGEQDGTINYFEHTLNPGVIVYVLVFVAIFTRKKFKNVKYFDLFLLSLLLAVILSFGPYGELLKTKIKLPYYYLYQYFPLITAIRTPTRIFLVALFFLSLITGTVIKKLAERKGLFNTFLLAILFLFTVIEYKTRIPMQARQYLSINYQLAGKKVLFFPFSDNFRAADYLSYSVKGKYIMMNGYHGTNTDDSIELMKEINKETFSARWFSIVKTLDLDLVIFDLLELENDKNLYMDVVKEIEDQKNKRFIVYKDKDWIIIDPSIYRTEACFSDNYKSLTIEPKLIKKENNQYNLSFNISNNSRCNLRFIYEKRYLKAEYTVTSNGRVKKKHIFITLYPFLLRGESSIKTLPFPEKLKKDDEVEVTIQPQSL